jgi:hypothetical protein
VNAPIPNYFIFTEEIRIMSTGDLPPWPEYRDFAMKFGPTNLASEAYNNALANASIARLRIAVELLEPQSKWLLMAAEEIAREGHDGWGNTCSQAADAIKEALSLIGDIPEET